MHCLSVSKAIAWAPSFNIGNGVEPQNNSWAKPFLDHLGPLPPTFLSYPTQALYQVACSIELLQNTTCTTMLEAGWGKSFGLAPIRPEYFSEYLTPVSAHEYLHLAQFQSMKRSHFFDYDNKEKNLAAYGQSQPPRYSPALISFEHLSLWFSKSDSLVTVADLETIAEEMQGKLFYFSLDR